jgi:adenosylcobinamide-phosphate synthase
VALGEVLIAFGLDLLFGDPEYKLHPVRVIGYAVNFFEPRFRKLGRHQRLNGTLFALFIVALSVLFVYALLFAASFLDRLFGIAFIEKIVSIFFIYSSISLKDLKKKAYAVVKTLKTNDIVSARKKLALIVGRDTKRLSRPEIVRALVETVSENIVDGIMAPLCYAFSGGPLMAVAYKSINTLDSMVGYKNKRYLLFGWAGARFDDVANFIPARIAGLFMPLASFFTLKNGARSLETVLRDGGKNPSPNSGIPEAAAAGALGVRLGGVNYYRGKRTRKPYLGEKIRPLSLGHVRDAIRIAYATSFVTLAAASAACYFLGKGFW